MSNSAIFLSSVTVETDPAGALGGDGSIGDPLEVLVDGVTITVNGSNQLVAEGGEGITGTLTAGQVPYATGATTVASSSGLTFDPSAHVLGPANQTLSNTSGIPLALVGSKGTGADGEPGTLALVGANWASVNGQFRYGDVSLTGGGSQDYNASFDGGNIFLTGGVGDTPIGDGGDVVITGGLGGGTGPGGNIYLRGGLPDVSGMGGNVTATAGNGVSNTGGSVALTAGNSDSGNAGSVTLTAGTASTGNHPGGLVEIFGGTGGDAITADGGAIQLFAGNANATGRNGGDVVLGTGEAGGSGIPGRFVFSPRNGDVNNGILDFNAMAGSDKTFTFPNASGTVALLNTNQVFLGSITATDFIVGNGNAFKTDTTDAHTGLIQAYDVDGAAYKTFGTLTNGNTPSLALAAPSGGTLTGNFTTLKLGGVDLVLTGTTGSIGGGLLVGVGSTATGTVTVAGAVVGQPVAVSASDGTLPNALISLSAAVTSANTVTVQLTALAAVTPTAKTYNVAVLP